MIIAVLLPLTTNADRVLRYFPTIIELSYSDTLKAIIEATDYPPKLTHVTLTWNGQSIAVPAEDIADINLPDLGAVHIQGEDDISPPYRHISLGFGATHCGINGCKCKVSFVFSEDEYRGRTVVVKLSNGSSQHFTKLPGEQEILKPFERDCGT